MDQFLHSKKTNERGERIPIATGAKSNDRNPREIKKNKKTKQNERRRRTKMVKSIRRHPLTTFDKMQLEV
jgi:hypothetical protein